MIDGQSLIETSDAPASLLITGGTGMLGPAIARALAGTGSRLGIQFRKNRELAERLVAELRDRGVEAECFECDLTDSEGASGLIDRFRTRFGRVDGLIHAAAGTIRPCAPLEDRDDEFSLQLELNVLAFVRLCREVLPDMQHRQAGLILPILSTVLEVSRPKRWTPYTASKFALTGALAGLSKDLSQSGVRAVGIMPAKLRLPTDVGVGAAQAVDVDVVGEMVCEIWSQPTAFANGKIVRMEGAKSEIGGLEFSGREL